jgi:hypothetical protein
MKNIKRFNWLVASLLVSMLAVSVSFAQDTASAIRGTVTDSSGNAISGATVTVKHESTGATKTLTTNASGNYQARGLRVGGPYTVTINSDGYNSGKQEDVYIVLGETKDVNVALAADDQNVEEVVVFGTAAETIFSADTMGSGTAISSETLENAPTISRSVQDFLRLDSRINIRDDGAGISVSGVNNRYNNFTIDGVSASDPFGLEDAGFAGIGQPFNIDAVEQLNVQFSPYDVTLSNFTGASINAVTKSGTNEFTGSLNYQYGDQDWTRDLAKFTNTQLSATFGGPIIKDKLFFFIGYEDTSKTEVPTETFVSQQDIQSVIDAAGDVYGITNLGASSLPNELDVTKENLLVKLDWQINEDHRLAFTYNTNEDNQPSVFSRSNIFTFGSSWFINNFKNDTYALNLYSDWNENFNTELRLSTAQFDKNPLGVDGPLSNLANVTIHGFGSGGDTIQFGRDIYRHANSLATTTDNFYLEGNYFVGDHTIKGGIEIQDRDIYNVFHARALGFYRFSSLDDFINGNINEYRYRIGVDPSDPFPAADWSWQNTALFIQDTWLVNDQLTLQYGLRWDKPSTDDKPTLNQTFLDVYGYANNNVPDTGVLQPRIGFNYDMSDELAMQLRGGIGIFSGGSPNVWLSNPFTNPGGNVNDWRFTRNSYTGSYIPGGYDQVPPASNPVLAIDLLEPGFKMPTVLKTNLALDAELPWYGLQATVEYEYTKQRNGLFYENLNLGDNNGTLPDGRLNYYSDYTTFSGYRTNRDRRLGDVMLLSNTGKGDTKRATVSLEKKTEHLFVKGSYTHTSTSEASPLGSSQAVSGWAYRPSFNANAQEMAASAYEIENAFRMQVAYNDNFFGDTETSINLFWTSTDGEPYSYIYGEGSRAQDINGDGTYTDLFFVPMPGQYVMSDPSEQAAFENFLTNSGLDQYRGQIPTRNSFKAPRINLWDLKVRQELPQMGMFKASVFFTIQNLGNLLNKDWGQVYSGYYRGVEIAKLNGWTADGLPILDFVGDEDVIGDLDRNRGKSQWQAQMGVRIEF